MSITVIPSQLCSANYGIHTGQDQIIPSAKCHFVLEAMSSFLCQHENDNLHHHFGVKLLIFIIHYEIPYTDSYTCNSVQSQESNATSLMEPSGASFAPFILTGLLGTQSSRSIPCPSSALLCMLSGMSSIDCNTRHTVYTEL